MNARILFSATCLAVVLLLHACTTSPAKSASKALPVADPMALGAAAEQRGDLQAALLQFAEAASLKPRSAETHYRVARIHAALGHGDTAREAYGRTLTLDPTHVGALEGFGLLLLEQRKPVVAATLLQKAVSADPKRWSALDGLGVVADLAGDHMGAQKRFDQAIALQPAQATLYNNRGYSRYLAGNLAGAKADFEHALSLQPGYAMAWDNLGLVRVRLGDPAGAAAAFGETMKPHQASNNVGYLLLSEGKYAPARQYLKLAITQSPSYYAEAQENLQRLEAAARERK